ncbi:hypothetical protein AG1IA_09667 [Rhizoctonia solani AG-1 IA]|uniref:Uncharacterized protein n=1 Tax=Thanatephorus cucumeris (strain AG1-IA) TaxID=983506 RepID=L8WHQ3_THACA|nr:hypothetical protein AG1IA_09667 [Rhizoctonia solani AG-1 IA]
MGLGLGVICKQHGQHRAKLLPKSLVVVSWRQKAEVVIQQGYMADETHSWQTLAMGIVVWFISGACHAEVVQ